jgi:hypothetical protein
MDSSIDVRRYSKLTGLLLLISVVAGGFGEAYVPTFLIVAGDSAATARNILAHPLMFRLGFAAYLIEATCDIGLAWAFYLLLRPVNRNVALLAAFFGILSTAVFAGAELFYFFTSYLLGGSKALTGFSPEQLNTLAGISLKTYAYGAAAFATFYGTATFIRGYLAYKSEFIPRILGVLLMLGGIGFMVENFTFVLTPAYSSDFLALPMAVGVIATMFWILIKGIDPAKWRSAAIT